MDRTLEEPLEKRAVIYVQIPFGCGHGTHAPEGALAADSATKHRYMQALAQEVAGALPLLAEYSVPAIYVGGGSPSAMRPDDVARLLRAVRAGCNLERGFELSFEVAPQTVCTPCLDGLKSGGVNRACLRVPSADDAVLERAGCAFRRTDVEEALAFLSRFRMREVSFEVAYGMPGQDVASLLETLKFLVALGPDHVSLMPWGKSASGTPAPEAPDVLDLLAAEAFPRMGEAAKGAEPPAEALAYLTGRGYACYAQAGGCALLARDGRASLYVRGCLDGCDVFGFGLGAVSLMGGVACVNTDSLPRYLEHAGSFDQIVARAERVEPERLAAARRP